jgi:hypothetical protein
MVRRFSDLVAAAPEGQKTPLRALQLWAVLVGLARERMTMTYEQASVALFDHDRAPHTVGPLLEPVLAFCVRNGLPRLNDLIVNKASGVPGYEEAVAGLDTAVTDYNAERERIFVERWSDIVPPTLEELLDAWSWHRSVRR